MKLHWPTVLVTLYALLLNGCGGGSSPRPPPPPMISAFAAKPSWVITGQGTTLSWTVSGATKLSISGVGAVAGNSVQVNPAADTTYVLTATNDSGSVQSQISVDVYPPPTVWFAPMPPNLYPNYGASDYISLFSPTAAWGNAAAHVTVFKIYPQVVDIFDDVSLRNLFADLKRRHIALAMEWGPLEPTASCGVDPGGVGIEGFSGATALHFAQKIHDLGGSLHYIAFDEPFEFGSIATGPGTCQWTPQQVAHDAAVHVAQIQTIFPDVVVGDIEAVPDGDTASNWLGAYQRWFDAWLAETGTPLAFFHFDIDWANDWKQSAIALARALSARHILVGQIYIGAGDAATDAMWMTSAEQRAADIETSARLRPDQIIFQSWTQRPKHLLPESDPTGFTYLINWYFNDRTTLTLSATAGLAQGQLTGPGGPLAQASIAVTETPSSGTGQVAAYQYSGAVPSSAQYVVFGARAGWEGCDFIGTSPAEFLLADFTIDAGTAGRVTADFTGGLTGWGIFGNASVAQPQGTNLYALTNPGQTFGLNSAPLSIAAADATYRLTVHATIPSGSPGGGCAIAVFEDASYLEVTRAVLPIAPLPHSLGVVQTDANGAYSVSLSTLPGGSTVSASYKGSDSLWPAAATVVTGLQSSPAVTTTALPDATVGSAYMQTLTASGGVPLFVWISGPLPPGLTLSQNGTLSGTPTATGTYALALSVVDHAPVPQAADASLQLVIH